MNWAGLDSEAWQGVLQAGGGSAVQAVLHKQGLPKRLAEALCQELDIVGTPVAQLNKVCSPDWTACCAVLHCAVLCCAMLCYAVLCCTSLPKHLAEALCQEWDILILRIVVLQADKLQLLEVLTAYKLNVTGHAGYAKVLITVSPCHLYTPL